MIRTILSPGIEMKEVDKSFYTSTMGTAPRALIMGFAGKGPSKIPTQITSLTDFQNIYGTPSNEAERYFYNAADIMLGSGATVVAARLPYANEPGYVAQSYTLNTPSSITAEISTTKDPLNVDLDELMSRDAATGEGIDGYKDELSAIYATDQTITKCAAIEQRDPTSLDFDKFTALLNGSRDTNNIGTNEIKIVDKSLALYKTYINSGSNVDCLGIMPVITTAANALAIAYQIDGVNMDDSSDISAINTFESINGMEYITSITESDVEATDSEISNAWSIYANTQEGANTLNSISKNAATFFPTISYSTNAKTTIGNNNEFDRSYFSYIGVVVYKIKVDKGTGNLYADPIEAYAGSLLRDAKDLRTNASIFIEDIVNTTSQNISIFVGDGIANNKTTIVGGEENSKYMDSNTILWVRPEKATILGIPPSEISKQIKYTDIITGMDDIFNSYSNVLANTLDVVVDAGLSTIGIHVGVNDGANLFEPQRESIALHTAYWSPWRVIVNKMKKFCETTRKDCVFVCDSPRDFSLSGRNKIVSGLNAKTSVANNILPQIKNIAGINTSYGWGYAIWYRIGCAYDGTSFWCPPSIFGANRYINTRTRYNVWDAPAGMTRGVISIDDTSFEPDLNARNTLYSNAWNYSLTYNQQGITCLEGQKTFQTKTSAFDRINVRSLFLYLERAVFNVAQNYLYEPNTAETRQNFVDNIEPIFSSILSRGGMYAYRIQCDETINTPDRIDNNELHIRFGVQPVKTIEFIMCEFVAVRTGSSWSELVEE